MQDTSIDICICTFQRDHIVDTIKSLARINIVSGLSVRIIVADNDDTPSAQEKVAHVALEVPFSVIYIHAPARNISIARNACLDAAKADYIAFIDDDELAEPEWLMGLFHQSIKDNADAVLGPVDAIYSAAAPAWMQAARFHDTRPVWVNNQIITGYTCNLLLRREVIEENKFRFRLDLGKSGGEDTEFLSLLHRAGGKISYAPDALIKEPVPDSRASLFWLIKRRFRSGQTHALLLMQNKNPKLKSVLVALAKSILCFTVAILCAWNKSRFCKWTLRGTLHVGVIAKLLGQKDLVQYG